MQGIYSITNLLNGKIYIGQSSNIERRWRDHKSRAYNINNRQYNCPLYQEMRQYGIQNFSFEVVEECSEKDLLDREKYWVGKYQSFVDGYNATKGGNSGFSQKLQDNDIQEIKDLLIQTDLTNQEIALKYNVSENMVCGINTGYYWFDDNTIYPLRKTYSNGALETKDRHKICPVCGKEILYNSDLCITCSAQNRRKVERPTKEELFNIILEHQGNFEEIGRMFGINGNSIRKWCKYYSLPSHSSDYKEKKEKHKNPPTNPKGVIQIDKSTDKIIAQYSSIYEAQTKTNIEHIGQVCAGKRKTAGGYKWQYINPLKVR